MPFAQLRLRALGSSPRARRAQACLSATRVHDRTLAHAATPTPATAATTAAPSLWHISPKAQQFQEIRQRICEEHIAGGSLLLSGAELVKRNGPDVFHKFRQDSNFYYVTGVHEPGYHAVFDTERNELTLVAPEVGPDMAIWTGGTPSLEETAEEVGATRCIYLRDLGAHLREWCAGQSLHSFESVPQTLREAGGIDKTTHVHLPGLLERCRAKKTRAEVACQLRASRISGEAHKAMWRACRPGMYEYQLEAVFAHHCAMHGLGSLGYPPIVGAGANAAILHYERNSARITDADVIMVDAGAEFNCYTADISRTFPAAGRFTQLQRDIYDATLRVQEHALSLVKPGALWRDIDRESRVLLLQLLGELQLVTGSVSSMLQHKVDRIFMPHGLGHHLGLDVHHESPDGPVPVKLEPGNVVTVEPGIYFMDLMLQRAAANPSQAVHINFDKVEAYKQVGGIRIEDNVYITGDGHVNLTTEAGVCKEAIEVEDIMLSGRS